MCVKCFVWVHLRWRGVLPGKTPRSSWVHLALCQHGIRNEPNCIQKELLNSLASITWPKHGSHLICIAPLLPPPKKINTSLLSLFWHHNGNNGPSLNKYTMLLMEFCKYVEPGCGKITRMANVFLVQLSLFLSHHTYPRVFFTFTSPWPTSFPPPPSPCVFFFFFSLSTTHSCSLSLFYKTP